MPTGTPGSYTETANNIITLDDVQVVANKTLRLGKCLIFFSNFLQGGRGRGH